MPFDLFAFICDLDDRIDQLDQAGYVDEAADLRSISQRLKGYVELRLVGDPPAGA